MEAEQPRTSSNTMELNQALDTVQVLTVLLLVVIMLLTMPLLAILLVNSTTTTLELWHPLIYIYIKGFNYFAA